MIPKVIAWDKENNEMLYPDDTDKILFEINEYGITTYDVRYLDEYGSFSAELDSVVMQSTGLLDKNGNEVFESQIVDVRTLEGTIYLRGIVKKVKGGFYIEGLHLSKNIPLTDFYFKSYTNTLEIEILGNIYQDEHLLEEE